MHRIQWNFTLSILTMGREYIDIQFWSLSFNTNNIATKVVLNLTVKERKNRHHTKNKIFNCQNSNTFKSVSEIFHHSWWNRGTLRNLHISILLRRFDCLWISLFSKSSMLHLSFRASFSRPGLETIERGSILPLHWVVGCLEQNLDERSSTERISFTIRERNEHHLDINSFRVI